MGKRRAKSPGPVLLLDVHRFRDKVAVYAASSLAGTLYMSEPKARAFAEAILAACDSIKTQSFHDSNLPAFTVTGLGTHVDHAG